MATFDCIQLNTKLPLQSVRKKANFTPEYFITIMRQWVRREERLKYCFVLTFTSIQAHQNFITFLIEYIFQSLPLSLNAYTPFLLCRRDAIAPVRLCIRYSLSTAGDLCVEPIALAYSRFPHPLRLNPINRVLVGFRALTCWRCSHKGYPTREDGERHSNGKRQPLNSPVKLSWVVATDTPTKGENKELPYFANNDPVEQKGYKKAERRTDNTTAEKCTCITDNWNGQRTAGKEKRKRSAKNTTSGECHLLDVYRTQPSARVKVYATSVASLEVQ